MLRLRKRVPYCLAVRVKRVEEREGYYVFRSVGAVETVMHEANILSGDWWFDQTDGTFRWKGRRGWEHVTFTARIGD